MQTRPNFWYSKLTLAAAGLTGFVMLCGAPQLRADSCQKRTERAAHHLHEAVEHHGVNSREADHARRQLSDAREYCWDHGHRWWDTDDNTWHNRHDWDDNDNQNYDHHDRDHHDPDDNH
ncbi:MAG: hypothetical protein ACRD4X_18030 [Candidatus Acidiferrales bacterium]